MSRALIAISSILVLAAGCRHGKVPALQAGRYSKAAPLVRRARKAAPLNAYVLETSQPR
jgi:hypothetical protein